MINNYKEHKVQENGINSSRLNHLLVYFYPLENSIFWKSIHRKTDEYFFDWED